MISIPECRKLLGSYADGLSDEKIEKMRNDSYKLADIIFEMWIERRNDPEFRAKLAKYAETDTMPNGKEPPGFS